MFIKPFKTKSNVQLKSSNRKKLQTKIATKFRITDENLNIIFPSKSTISQMKIITHSDEIVTVYTSDKRPLFFETPDETLFPTVYTLWLIPNLLPLFTTHPAVLPRLANGADLMLPGVIKIGQGLRSYGFHKKNEIVAVNLTSNKAAVGIGLLAKSSEDFYMAAGAGVCVKMIHVFGDKLWEMESSVSQQIPFLGAGFEMPKDDDFPVLGDDKNKKSREISVEQKQAIIKKTVVSASVPIDEFPALGMDSRKKQKETVAPICDKINELTISNVQQIDSKLPELETDDNVEPKIHEPKESPTEISEDDILKNAFLTALKREGKTLTLPLLTSNFYRCHILPVADRQIDLKKTSYKKLSNFLSEMAANRFITLKEEQKGIEKITGVNLTHPDLLEFIPKVQNRDEKQPSNNLFVTEMTELYLVTEETATFFAHSNIGIGDGVEIVQLKKILKEYVCNNKLQDPLNPRIIHVNDLLLKICQRDEDTIPFEAILQIILSKMTHSYEMRNKTEIKSGKNTMILMTLATRSGNKKVTLVNNLEAFSIRLDEFEKACKIGVAASTTISKLPYQKGEQLLVQGNQIRFIYKLLTETYKVPPKNIIGLDLAKKEKKPSKK